MVGYEWVEGHEWVLEANPCKLHGGGLNPLGTIVQLLVSEDLEEEQTIASFPVPPEDQDRAFHSLLALPWLV